MTAVDDRTRIGRAFHRQAGEYDQHASVQKRVVSRLDQLVATHQKDTPVQVLDIGCGTGAMLATLQGRYPRIRPYGLDLAFNMAKQSRQRLAGEAMLVNGAAEQLPFSGGAFDLVVSASTLQWVDNLDACFAECHRVLQNNGLLCAAFFGGRTLWEMHECYREAVSKNYGDHDVRKNRLHRFREIGEVQRAVSCFGNSQVLISRETEIEYHADVSELLRSIKAIGAATTARHETTGGLGGRKMLADMANIYHSRFKKEGVIPVTYEVIYIVARRCAD